MANICDKLQVVLDSKDNKHLLNFRKPVTLPIHKVKRLCHERGKPSRQT